MDLRSRNKTVYKINQEPTNSRGTTCIYKCDAKLTGQAILDLQRRSVDQSEALHNQLP